MNSETRKWYKQEWLDAGYTLTDEEANVAWNLGLRTQNHKGMIEVILTAYMLGKGHGRRMEMNRDG